MTPSATLGFSPVGVSSVSAPSYRVVPYARRLSATRDDHRRVDRVHDSAADRPQQHAGEAAAAVTAHHEKLSGFGSGDQVARRLVEHHPAMNPDVGVAVLPPGHTFGQRLLGL